MCDYLKNFVKDAVKEEKSLHSSRKQGYLLIGEKFLRTCLEYSVKFQRYNPSVIQPKNRTFRKDRLNNLKYTEIGFANCIMLIFLSYITT